MLRHKRKCNHAHKFKVSESLDKAVRHLKLQALLQDGPGMVVCGKRVPMASQQLYLGSMLASNGSSVPEATRRAGMAERKCYSRMGVWKNSRIRTTRKKQLYRGILSSLLYGCETWKRDDHVLQKINGAHARMMSMITGRSREEEASESRQTFNVKKEMSYRARKWALKLLRAHEDSHARQALLQHANAARNGRINKDYYLLEGIDLMKHNDNLIKWAGHEDADARRTPKDRGWTEDNRIAREDELEKMKPNFWEEEEETAYQEKIKEKKLAKRLEEKKMEHTEPQAQVAKRQKKRAMAAIANLPPHTLLMFTDGGHRPLQDERRNDDNTVYKPAVTEEAAGWGAVIWHRVDQERNVDDRPRKYTNRKSGTAGGNRHDRELHRIWGPVCLKGDDARYKAAKLPYSSNMAEIEAVVSVLILALSMKDLPENLALIVDSRVAFYKVTGWLTHRHKSARLTGAAGYGRELIDRLNRRGVTIHWIWVKGHAKVDGNEAADAGATEDMGRELAGKKGYYAQPTERQAPAGKMVTDQDDGWQKARTERYEKKETQAQQDLESKKCESPPWQRAREHLEQVREEETTWQSRVQKAKDSTQKAAATAQELCMTADQEEREANAEYQERCKAEREQEALVPEADEEWPPREKKRAGMPTSPPETSGKVRKAPQLPPTKRQKALAEARVEEEHEETANGIKVRRQTLFRKCVLCSKATEEGAIGICQHGMCDGCRYTPQGLTLLHSYTESEMGRNGR